MQQDKFMFHRILIAKYFKFKIHEKIMFKMNAKVMNKTHIIKIEIDKGISTLSKNDNKRKSRFFR